MTEEDFEWFEFKYPGWYYEYGKWWEHYARLSKPNGHKPIAFEDTGYVYPHRCWTCMVPCMIREDTIMDTVDGQVRTYCSKTCHWTDKVAFRGEYEGRPTPAMGRLVGKREWETCYHGWDLVDVMKDQGFVRPDGKTLIPQPHVIFDDKAMWTLDHLKGIEFQSPNVLLNQMTPEQREAHMADYKKGFAIK